MIHLDSEQVIAARQGDRAALASLVRSLQRPVYGLAVRMLAHPADAEDATQDILIEIVTHLGTIRDDWAAGGWALKVASRHLVGMRKRSRVEAMRMSFEDFADDLDAGRADPEDDQADSAITAIAIEEIKIGRTLAMLTCLTRGLRIAYVLGNIFEMSDREAAAALEISATGCRQRPRPASTIAVVPMIRHTADRMSEGPTVRPRKNTSVRPRYIRPIRRKRMSAPEAAPSPHSLSTSPPNRKMRAARTIHPLVMTRANISKVKTRLHWSHHRWTLGMGRRFQTNYAPRSSFCWRPSKMDPLSDIISFLRLRGYLLGGFRAGETWLIGFDAHEAIKCYAVTAGACWIAVEGAGAPVFLEQGDCFMLPRGQPFRIASDRSPPAEDWRRHFLGAEEGALVQLNDGTGVTELGGHFALAGPQAEILLGMLPPIAHLRGETEGGTLRRAFELMRQELIDLKPGGILVAQRLAAMIFIQALRLCLNGAKGIGWLFALSDQRVGAAIKAIHREPSRRWTLETLAAAADMSRSGVAAQFRHRVGESPTEYLTQWRMHLAGRSLEQGAPIGAIAHALGYASESAFRTAFKRVTGRSPRQHARSFGHGDAARTLLHRGLSSLLMRGAVLEQLRFEAGPLKAFLVDRRRW